MNKVQELFSKIKLKDYEKKWLVSWVAFILAILIIPTRFSNAPDPFKALFVIVMFLWMAMNVVGLIYSISMWVRDWFENLDGTSWIVKTINWFNTSDRN